MRAAVQTGSQKDGEGEAERQHLALAQAFLTASPCDAAAAQTRLARTAKLNKAVAIFGRQPAPRRAADAESGDAGAVAGRVFTRVTARGRRHSGDTAAQGPQTGARSRRRSGRCSLIPGGRGGTRNKAEELVPPFRAPPLGRVADQPASQPQRGGPCARRSEQARPQLPDARRPTFSQPLYQLPPRAASSTFHPPLPFPPPISTAARCQHPPPWHTRAPEATATRTQE